MSQIAALFPWAFQLGGSQCSRQGLLLNGPVLAASALSTGMLKVLFSTPGFTDTRNIKIPEAFKFLTRGKGGKKKMHTKT